MDFKTEAWFDKIYQDYDRYLLVPAALLVLAVGILGFNYVSTGEFLQKGTDFTGGTQIIFQVQGEFTTQDIEKTFAAEGRKVNAVRQSSGNETSVIVQMPPPQIDRENATAIMEAAGYSVTLQSFRSISSSVSEKFFVQAQLAFLFAFTIMSLVIFIAFKDVVPSLAVIFAALSDIIFAAAGMVIFGIPLTLGSLAALLMLLGYSVDTDIVLSTRVLKRTRGALKGRIWSSVKTGVTMSSGGIAGFAILYVVSTAIAGPSELSNIAGVMVIGLLADMPFTWFGNAIVLKKYVNNELDEVLPWK